MKRDKNMQATLDWFSKSVFGLSNTEAIKQRICISCKENADKFEDSLSEKEYTITALCQKCQNMMG